jgi:drug/metabolite transporter (DMT)-like permease
LISLFGILLFSFDTVLLKLAGVSAWDALFWRGLFATAPSAIILFAMEKKTVVSKIKEDGFPLVLSGVMWGLSGLFFVVAVNMTVAANVLVIISISPLFAALFGYILFREKIKITTALLFLLSVTGVIIVFSADIGGGSAAGNITALGTPVVMGANLAIMRKHQNISRISAVIIGGFTAALISFVLGSPFSIPVKPLIYLAILGLICVPFAQFFLSTGTKYIPAAQVALITMLETVLGPVWVWLCLGEIPPSRTFLGGIFVLAGVTVSSIVSARSSSASAP